MRGVGNSQLVMGSRHVSVPRYLVVVVVVSSTRVVNYSDYVTT